MVQLSITIPTYDRLPQLAETLKALFAEPLPPGVELVILDNHSPSRLEPEVRSLPGIDLQRIRFIRHSANIGLAANLLRCFEVAAGPWVWTLGDDDLPLPGAVQSILEEIKATDPEDILLKFNSTNGGQVNERYTIGDLEQLSKRCGDIGFYSNFLFISTSVFRKKVVLDRLNVGHHWAYSLAPHVAILLHAMAIRSAVKLVPRELVRHGPVSAGQQWNSVRLKAGLNSLGDIEGTEVFAASALPKLTLSYLRPRLWRNLALCFLSKNERSPRFWRSFY